MALRREQVKHSLVFGFGGALAIVLLIFAIASTDTDPVDDNGTTLASEHLVPQRGATVPLQAPVGIELDADGNFDAQIYVDGTPIPRDEYLAGDPGLGQFIFKPGADAEGNARFVREWTQGRHEVRVTYWPATSSEDVGPTNAVLWYFIAG